MKNRQPMVYRKDDLPVKVDEAVLLSLDQDAHDVGPVEHLNSNENGRFFLVHLHLAAFTYVTVTS
jgi:hypothetical protein